MRLTPDTRLRAVYSAKFDQWRLCHDQWCERGETSIVATITSTGDAQADEAWAKELEKRWNAGARA